MGLDSPLGEEEETESKLGCALGGGVATASSLGCVEEDGGGGAAILPSGPQEERKRGNCRCCRPLSLGRDLGLIGFKGVKV